MMVDKSGQVIRLFEKRTDRFPAVLQLHTSAYPGVESLQLTLSNALLTLVIQQLLGSPSLTEGFFQIMAFRDAKPDQFAR